LDTSEEVAGCYFISSGKVIKINANDWQRIRISLNITGNNKASRENIRILRFRIRSNSGKQCRIVIVKIAISGNKREKTGMNLNNFSIFTMEKFDPEYKSILTNRHYLNLYGIENTVTKDE
jgi:hypothetical protein